MSRTTLKALVLIALGSLVVYEIASIVAGFFSHVWGFVSSIAVAGVTFLCAWMATGGRRMKGWYLAPTILFVVLPTGYRLVRILLEEKTGLDVAVALAPLVAGFLLPAGILLFIYWRLVREDRHTSTAMIAPTSQSGSSTTRPA